MPITSLIMVQFSICLHCWNCLSVLYTFISLILTFSTLYSISMYYNLYISFNHFGTYENEWIFIGFISCRKHWNIHTLYQYIVIKCLPKMLKRLLMLYMNPLINNVTSNSKFSNCQARVAEWFTAPCLLCAAWIVVGLSPNLHQCLQTHLQVCGSKRLGCHADLCTVNRCCTRGESQELIAHRQQSMQVRDPPWLWYQWPHEKDLFPPNNILKKVFKLKFTLI